MNTRRITVALRSARRSVARALSGAMYRAFGRHDEADAPPFSAERTLSAFSRYRGALIALAVVGTAGTLLWKHPPMQSVGRGEVGIRTNQLTGSVTEWREGSFFVFPGLHEVRVLLAARPDLPAGPRRGNAAALQSVEGLSIGVDIAVRYALDPARVAAVAKNLPDEHRRRDRRAGGAGRDLPGVRPLHGARDLLQQARRDPAGDRSRAQAPAGCRRHRAASGVQIGKVDLPADYKRGMEALLAEELATEKMRYTLELKDKRVKETELEAEADKVRREKAAEAAGARTDHRRQGAGRGDEARAAVQAEADRAAPAGGRGREAVAHQAWPKAARRRAASRPPARPIRGRSWPTPKPTGWSASARSTREQMAREGALVTQQPAADPEDPGRQALGQDPGDHRAAAGRRRLHRQRRCWAATPGRRGSDDARGGLSHGRHQ